MNNILLSSIQIERINSQKYGLIKDIYHPDLLALTIDNVARVEAMIATDSNYMRSADAKQDPKIDCYKKNGNGHKCGDFKAFIYRGSTAYWMQELRRYICPVPLYDRQDFVDNNNNIVQEWDMMLKDMICDERQYPNYRLALTIYGTISAIDRENSTHLTADSKNNNYGNGRIELTKRIFDLRFDLLRVLREGRSSIITKLTEITKGGEKGGRENYSFATKFCHYACYYWFAGTPEQDNYSIYDNVLCGAVVHYANIHGVHHTLNNGIAFCVDDFSSCDKYDMYMKVIDELRTKHGENISRNGFDHLLWYYHKGHPL